MQALERLSFGSSGIRETVIAQSRITLFWYYTTYLLLEKNKPKYQTLEHPLPPPNQIQKNLELVEPLESDPVEPSQEEPESSPPADQGKLKQVESSPADPLNLFTLDGL